MTTVTLTFNFASENDALAFLQRNAPAIAKDAASPQPPAAAATKPVKPASEPRTATAAKEPAAAEPKALVYADLQAAVMKRLPAVTAAGRMADFLALAGQAKDGAKTFKDLSTPAELAAAIELVNAFDLAATAAESVV